MKKSCHNCKHLKYHEAQGGETLDTKSGFYCEGRAYDKGNSDSYAKEQKHLKQLDKEDYRLSSKKCCVLKNEVKDDTYTNIDKMPLEHFKDLRNKGLITD